MSAETEKPGETNKRGMLAQAVTKVLDDKGWSLAAAEIATKVGRGTLHNMKRGVSVRPEQVAKFARAIAPRGEEEATVKQYLGYLTQDKTDTMQADMLLFVHAGQVTESPVDIAPNIVVTDYIPLDLRVQRPGRLIRENPEELEEITTESYSDDGDSTAITHSFLMDSIVIHAEGFRDLDEVERMQAALIAEGAAKAFIDSLRTSRSVASIGGGASPEEKAAEQAKQDDFMGRLRNKVGRQRDE